MKNNNQNANAEGNANQETETAKLKNKVELVIDAQSLIDTPTEEIKALEETRKENIRRGFRWYLNPSKRT